MKLTILGMGTPVASASVFGTAYVLEVGGALLMFDCGPAATYKLARAGIRTTQINKLFFTHHHFDHDVDYPCFLLSRWDIGIGREAALEVYGPPPTELLTKRILDPEIGAFSHDWLARVNHPLSQNAFVLRGGTLPRPAPRVEAHDIGPGKVCTGPDWELTAGLASHVEPWLTCLSYRIDSSEGRFVFTGDTRRCPTVVELARGADTLLCMCLDHQDSIEATGTHLGQMGTTEAARLGAETGAKRLILVHQREAFARPGSMERAIADIAAIYKGEIIFPREFMQLELG